MNLDELKRQLSNKQKTTDDLFRFIRTRTDSNPNYTLFLGAGCSVTSGVRPATSLCDEWRNDIIKNLAPELISNTIEEKKEWLKKEQGDWYDPQKEYSTLFERKYDLQRQRRMFVENEVREARPSIGYAYLTALVEQCYFNTIFTTNFDDLINEAFFLYSKQRPIVCAHDSSINSVTVTSKRPKIIKLHGDYLFDDIKATERETESLGHNMKEKFIEFAKDYGVIFLGYSGGDRSIIDVLTMLLKNEDYYKHGIYWCLRKGSDIPEDLRRLIWKDRVYFVEVDGFDELFAELYSTCNKGECLPPSALNTSLNQDTPFKHLLAMPRTFPETTTILRTAKERLLRQSKRKAIANSIINPENKDRPLSNSSYTDDELLILTNLQRLLADGKHKEVVSSANNQLDNCTNLEVSSQVVEMLVEAYVALKDEASALAVIDKQDRQDINNYKWQLLKSRVVSSRTSKLEAIQEALNRNDEAPACYRALGKYHEHEASLKFGADSKEHENSALEAYKKAIELDPSARNSCWGSMHSLLMKTQHTEASRNQALNDLEADLSKQGKMNWRLMQLKVNRLTSRSEDAEVRKILDTLKEAKSRDSVATGEYYDGLALQTHRATGNAKESKLLIDKLIRNRKHISRSGLAVDIALCFRETIGDDREAIKILSENLASDDFDSGVFYHYCHALLDLSEFETFNQAINTHGSKISEELSLKLKRELAEHLGDITTALDILDQERKINDNPMIQEHSYLMLLAKDYEGAKTLCGSHLKEINYSGEAAAVIVNYELARLKTNLKVDHSRLDRVLSFDASDTTKAAISALRGHKKEAIDFIKSALRADKSFKYSAARWPVFEDMRNDASWRDLFDK